MFAVDSGIRVLNGKLFGGQVVLTELEWLYEVFWIVSCSNKRNLEGVHR
jgi:hypothetical protein